MRDYANAIDYLRTTEELDPGHFSNPQISLAEIYLWQSEPGAALRELESFVKIHPDSPEIPKIQATIDKLRGEAADPDTFM